MNRKRILNEAEVYRLPQPPAPAPTVESFAVCPLILMQGLTAEQFMMQQWLYRCALAQAQAVVRPSLPERDLLAVWN